MSSDAVTTAARRKREEQLALDDWSYSRAVGRLLALQRDRDTEADVEVQAPIRAKRREANRLAGELVGPVQCPDLEDGVALVLPAADEGEAAELRRVRQDRIVASAREGVRLAEADVEEGWKFRRGPNAPAVMGPARSYLPVMDEAEQVEASYTLGRHRDPLAEAKARRDYILRATAKLAAELEVCTGGSVTRRPRSRRSTRGKGRKVRR